MQIDERHEQVKKALCAYTSKITESPAAARKALVREGIYTPSGKLSGNYTSVKRDKR